MKRYQYPEIQIMFLETQDILTFSPIKEIGDLPEIDFEELF